MKFSTLVHEIHAYIERDHAHSTWNMKYLYCTSSKDPQGLTHYRISYKEPGRKFSIKICKNNIKFHNIQNLPGSVSSKHARILGPCIRFARHHGRYNGMGEKAWKQMREEYKYANYDIQQFDNNHKSNKSYATIGYDGITGKTVINEANALSDILDSPKETLGQKLTMPEFDLLALMGQGAPIAKEQMPVIKNIFKRYEEHTNVEVVSDNQGDNHNE